jgi:hypothetical protein
MLHFEEWVEQIKTGKNAFMRHTVACSLSKIKIKGNLARL